MGIVIQEVHLYIVHKYITSLLLPSSLGIITLMIEVYLTDTYKRFYKGHLTSTCTTSLLRSKTISKISSPLLVKLSKCQCTFVKSYR